MAQGTTRSEWIKLRVSPAEKALMEERARAAGLGLSEYIRREAGIGHYGRTGLRAGGGQMAPRPERGGNFEGRVRELGRRMPRANAERLARREQAAEKARAALAR